MQIEVKIRRLHKASGCVKATASALLDGVLAIHDMKVIQGVERMFVAMPRRFDERRGFRDIVHPVNAQLRAELEDAVIGAYRKIIP